MTSHQNYKLALQTFQSSRLRRDHADLAAEPQYREIGEFFFQELYGPRDFTARDEQAQRLRQFVHLAPGLAVRDVEQVLKLLALTNRLDEALIEQLIAVGAPLDFDEVLYERAYRLADNYADRVFQIDLVRDSLYNVYRMARKPLIGTVLQRTQGLARTAGMNDIHRFLRTGYQAILPVRDIHRFIETICLRERDRLDRIFDR
jgi:hypothetical protein